MIHSVLNILYRSDNYFLPCYSYVEFVTATDKFGGICYPNFQLIIHMKRTDMSRYLLENTFKLKYKNARSDRSGNIV